MIRRFMKWLRCLWPPNPMSHFKRDVEAYSYHRTPEPSRELVDTIKNAEERLSNMGGIRVPGFQAMKLGTVSTEQAMQNLFKWPIGKGVQMPITLGQKYKEKVHGRKGIAVSRTEFLTGCARILVEYLNPEGEVKDFCVDEILLVEVESPPPPPPGSDNYGGPGEVSRKPLVPR